MIVFSFSLTLLLLEIFPHQHKMIVFHWSLSDSEPPKISRTLLNILTDLNNAVVWIVSALPSIYNSFKPFTKPYGIVSSAPITISITVTFIFHNFFWFYGKIKIFVSSFVFFDFHSVVGRNRLLLIIIIIIMIIYSLRIFHSRISWWFPTGVWVTASLLKSPGLVLVFWPSSTMLLFGSPPLVLISKTVSPCTNPLVTVPSAPL